MLPGVGIWGAVWARLGALVARGLEDLHCWTHRHTGYGEVGAVKGVRVLFMLCVCV
jgi:hypothetical protein